MKNKILLITQNSESLGLAELALSEVYNSSTCLSYTDQIYTVVEFEDVIFYLVTLEKVHYTYCGKFDDAVNLSDESLFNLKNRKKLIENVLSEVKKDVWDRVFVK